ncbi:unnamed protein product [Rhodiola kirilowii]
MPTLRSRNRSTKTGITTVTVTTPSQCATEEDMSYENVGAEMEEEEESDVLDYEQTREKRIKENMERMQKLGISDMSLQLKSAIMSSKPARKRKALDFKNTPVREADVFPRPTRRSSRLQNVTPVSYVEVGLEKKGNNSRSRDIYLEVGSKPEVYTEEHDKLLGDCNTSWTLFVDGYGKDGKRIYDSVRGKTCHQCRQKTLGHRTTCSKCNMVQGQFCGDCLYMRYGEHVLEANQNPEWICPPCRGICNCSLCRQAKGWAPTGPLYRKIASLGYKSVAYFLFQTRRSQTDDGNDPQTETPSSMALPIADDSPSITDNVPDVIAQYSDIYNGRTDSETEEKKDDDMHAEDGHSTEQSGVDPDSGDNENSPKAEVEKNAPKGDFATDHSALEVTDDNKQENTNMYVAENGISTEHMGTYTSMEIVENEHESELETPLQVNDLATKNSVADVGNGTNENEHLAFKGMLLAQDQEHLDINTPDKTSARKRRSTIVEPSPDSIAGRLRLRRKGLWNFESTN